MWHWKARYLVFVALVVIIAGQLCSAAVSDNPSGDRTAAANNPSEKYRPDPAHIPFILPQKIPWKGRAGHLQFYNILGSPRDSGPYIQILRWWPGNFSKPHFHPKQRYITVLSGTWWVSSSTHFDPEKTYPLPAGTLAQDVANTVHWDGARADGGPVVLEIVGDGPAPNIYVDEDGKPISKAARKH